MTKPRGTRPVPVPCRDCGALIERKYDGRGQRPQRCEPCRDKHLAKKEHERGQRRAREAREGRACPRCGNALTHRAHRRTPYCDDCYPVVKRERLNAKERERRHGNERTCLDCGVVIGVTGSYGKRRCGPCLKRRQKLLALAMQWGITLERYEALLATQEGRCAICRSQNSGKRGWCVDHDHACCDRNGSCGGCVRGLLCGRCNALLGHAQDNPETLAAAIAYLRNPPALT